MTPKDELIEAIARSPEEMVQILLKILRTLEHQQFLKAAQQTQPPALSYEPAILNERSRSVSERESHIRLQWLTRLQQLRQSQSLPGEPLSATIVRARQEERH